MKTHPESYLPVAQDDSSDFDGDRSPPAYSFWGSRILTGTFIATFALSVACNIYTITFANSSALLEREPIAETVQLSSDETPFGIMSIVLNPKY